MLAAFDASRALAQAPVADDGAAEGTASPLLCRSPAASAPAPSSRLAGAARFLAGGAVGLLAHEGGHLAFDYAFGASPGVRAVHFGPLPFFAITHRRLSPRREFLVSSAGFWAQHLGTELLLTARPRLRSERAPLAKGLLAFNILASAAYAGGAVAHAGPVERDTRSMAVFLGIDEGAVGAMLLAPAVFDTVRYFRPEARWPVWASRAAKAGMVLLALKRGR